MVIHSYNRRRLFCFSRTLEHRHGEKIEFLLADIAVTKQKMVLQAKTYHLFFTSANYLRRSYLKTFYFIQGLSKNHIISKGAISKAQKQRKDFKVPSILF